MCSDNCFAHHAWLKHMNKLSDHGYPGYSNTMPWQHSCVDLATDIERGKNAKHHWREAFQVLFSRWVWILACNYSRDGTAFNRGTEINNCQIKNMECPAYYKCFSVCMCIMCIKKRQRITKSAIEWWLEEVKELHIKTKSEAKLSWNLEKNLLAF